jgi:hypothetical protein
VCVLDLARRNAEACQIASPRANRPARRSASRLAQSKRERGRQTTAILVTSPATFRRPRRCAAVPRVQAHRQRPSDPTLWRSTPGCCVRDRRATALVTCERRCRRASVRAVAGGAQPRSSTPDLRGRAGPRGTRANGNIHAASSGSPVVPHVRRSSLTRPSDGQDAGSMREAFGGGISL